MGISEICSQKSPLSSLSSPLSLIFLSWFLLSFLLSIEWDVVWLLDFHFGLVIMIKSWEDWTNLPSLLKINSVEEFFTKLKPHNQSNKMQNKTIALASLLCLYLYLKKNLVTRAPFTAHTIIYLYMCCHGNGLLWCLFNEGHNWWMVFLNTGRSLLQVFSICSWKWLISLDDCFYVSVVWIY